MNMKKLLLACIALAAVSSLAYSIQAQIIVAHRGLFLRPGKECAENTICAVTNAYANGYNNVELDIRTTSDGTAVIMHDNAVNPQTGVNANFAGFSPQRTTNYDGEAGNYTPWPYGAFSLVGSTGVSSTPLNPSLATMESNFTFMKVYNQAGSILSVQTPGYPSVPYPWHLQQVLQLLSSEYPGITIVLDIQSVEALAAAKAVVAAVLPANPIWFKVWTTALSAFSGIPDAGLASLPPQYQNLVVSDNMIERSPSDSNNVLTNDGNQSVAWTSINTTNLTTLKGIEYFVQGTSADATISANIQIAPPNLQKWGVLRLYDFTFPDGWLITNSVNGESWTCASPYLIGSTGLCYMTANTGKFSAAKNVQVQDNQELLNSYLFDYVTEDVYAPATH
jgi:hypothetical protein